MSDAEAKIEDPAGTAFDNGTTGQISSHLFPFLLLFSIWVVKILG
jgi:hypothetical protein